MSIIDNPQETNLRAAHNKIERSSNGDNPDMSGIRQELFDGGLTVLGYTPKEGNDAKKQSTDGANKRADNSSKTKGSEGGAPDRLLARNDTAAGTKTDTVKGSGEQPPPPPPIPPTARLEQRTVLSEAEKQAGVSYVYDGQFPGSTAITKYGYNKAGEFAYLDNGEHTYRNLSAEDLKALNLPGQRSGWYLMDDKDHTKVASKLPYDDVRFLPPDDKGNGGIFVARHSKDIAYAWGQDGIAHQGRINAVHTFTESDQYGNATWILRADGSQVRGEYAYEQQKPGQKTPLKSFTEISAKGETLTFKQDDFNKDRYVRLGSDGKVLEERYKPILDGRLYSWEDKAGVSTLIFGDSAVEHGHLFFGDANEALNYRASRKQKGAVPLEPATMPTFCIDNQGRTSAILAPEKGDKDGANGSINGGVDRCFSYSGDTDRMNAITAIRSKGEYANLMFTTTRIGESEQWNVPVGATKENRPVVDRWGRRLIDRETGKLQTKEVVTPQYAAVNGARGFVPGTRDYFWREPIGPQGKQFEVARVNHSNGSIDRIDAIVDKNSGAKIVRYFDAAANQTGVQWIDAQGNQSEKITRATHPGVNFDLAGNVNFKDKNGNEHHRLANGAEAILNPTDWTYLQKDSSGRIVRAGQLDQNGRTDERNSLRFDYANGAAKAFKTVDGGKEEEISNGPGLVTPEGEYWHDISNGMVVIERPDLSTLHREFGKNGAITEASASNAAFDVKREMPKGQDPHQPDRIVDTLTDKTSNVKYRRELVGVDPDKAVESGLQPLPVRQYVMTLSEISPDGKEKLIIPPPPKPGEAPQPGEPRIFTALEVLSNGEVQATDIKTLRQLALPIPRSPEQFKDYIMPDHVHLARSRERFEALIKEELNPSSGPIPQINRPSNPFSRYDHAAAISNLNAAVPSDAQVAQIMNRHEVQIWTADNQRRPLPDGIVASQYDYAIARIMADRNQSQPWPVTLRAQAMERVRQAAADQQRRNSTGETKLLK